MKEHESGFVVDDDAAGYNLNFDFADEDVVEEGL